MWFDFWKRKKPKTANALSSAGALEDVVPSLRQAAQNAGLPHTAVFLSIPTGPGAENAVLDRSEILIGDGLQVTTWQAPPLRDLFRGDRQPPPDGEMERYPQPYLPFFYRAEFNVFRFCRTREINPTDGEFLELYSFMKRRPDGKSMGPLHDVIWQSAALVLGLRPWSEAEYLAVFGQLARSARHFKIGPTSRNYIAYVRDMMERAGAS